MRCRASTFVVRLMVIAVGVAITIRAAGEISVSSPAAAPPDPAAISRLINQLGDSSYQRRQDATQTLGQMGLLARPALMAAAHQAVDPEVRSRAAGLLCVLPWGQTDDPLLAGRALNEYQSADSDRRIAVLESMGGDPHAARILLRLLSEEPSDDVRWVIAQKLRAVTDSAIVAKLRETRLDTDDAVMLALAGWAWEPTDLHRAESYLRRAADMAEDHPVDDHGELGRILAWLRGRAILEDRGADAIDMARRLVWQSPNEQVGAAVANLFVTYAQFGPLPSFNRDLTTFSVLVSDPTVAYALGQMYLRHGQPVVAQAYFSTAEAGTLADLSEHSNVGEFLLNHGWVDLAEREYQSALNYPGELGQPSRFFAQIMLARCADALGNDAQAVADLTAAQETLKGLPPGGNNDRWPELLPAEVNWYELKTAIRDENRAAMTFRVDQLLVMMPKIPDADQSLDINIDMVRALKKLGRAAAAQKLFEGIYAQPRATPDQKGPTSQSLNDLAWLCARCGEHTEEAYQWATEALQLSSPGAKDYAANLDTAAEAAAGVGKFDEAVQHETDALKLMPDDWFMRGQLARFRELAAHALP